MNIFLWGFMGAGKSKLGKRLANRLNYKFVDLDNYIETENAQTITEIFAQNGETSFRTLETKYLEKLLLTNDKMLISCGGGTPCFNENHSLMNEKGVTIFLEVDESILVDRLWEGKAHRPLIAKMKDKTELGEYIQQTLKERKQYYETAHLCFTNSYPKGDLSILENKVKERIVEK